MLRKDELNAQQLLEYFEILPAAWSSRELQKKKFHL